LHFVAEDFVHVGLVALFAAAEPGQDVGVKADADELFDGAVEATDVTSEGSGSFSGESEKSILLSGLRETLQVATLLVIERRDKERARGDSLFWPR
jgi:hypothetical protein